MNLIILNEKEYAEKCISNCDVGKNPFNTLCILAKYYYSLGYKKKDIEKNLNQFMETNYVRYNVDRSSWIETIDKIVRNSRKYTLYENDGVWITESELSKIDELPLKNLKTLMFTILCLAKLGNLRNEKNNGWVNNDAKEIFKLARVTCTVAERDDKIGYLKELGYLEFAKKNDNLSVRVTFIDDDSDKKLHVTDFRELGYAYLKYCGENIVKCRECGILFRNSKSGNRKYCSNCQGYIKQDNKKIICVDCGKEFNVAGNNKRTIRCNNCQKKFYNKEMRIKMANRKLSSNNIAHIIYGEGDLYYIDSSKYTESICVNDMNYLCHLKEIELYREFKDIPIRKGKGEEDSIGIHVETRLDCDLDGIDTTVLPKSLCIIYSTHNKKGDSIDIFAPKCRLVKSKNNFSFVCKKYSNSKVICYIKEHKN